MSPLQEKLIQTARDQYQYKETEEFVELFKSTEDQETLRTYFKALRDGYERRDYVPPASRPPEKVEYDFEVPNTNLSTKTITQRMEKKLSSAEYNQFMQLSDAKQKLESSDFTPVMARLISQTLDKIDCTAHQLFYVFRSAAMQFGLTDSESSLMGIINKIYTEYKHHKDTEEWKLTNQKAELSNQVAEESNDKYTSWKDVALRVIKDKSLTKVFPFLNNLDLEDKNSVDILAHIVCIKVSKEKHLLLDPKTLKYTFEVRDSSEVITLISQQFQYKNPLCIISREIMDKDDNLRTVPVPKGELYDMHVMITQYTEIDLRAPVKYELALTDDQLGVKQSGVTRAKIDQVYSEDCDLWMRKAFGTYYEKIRCWVAHCLDFNKPLPVLSIIGPPNTGKSLLIGAVQEQIKDAEANLTPVSYHESGYNGALLSNPFIVADDGGLVVTPDNRELWKDRFKNYVTHSSWAVNPKYGGQTTLHGHLRCYCAFNKDKPHVRAMFNEKNDALGQRIYDVEILEDDAQAIVDMFDRLDVLGDNDQESRWLKNGHLTKHVAWLIAHKDKYPVPNGTGRWGNLSDYKFIGAVATSKTDQLILEFLEESLEDNAPFCRRHTDSGTKYIDVHIKTFMDAFKDKSRLANTSKQEGIDILKNLGASDTSSRMNGQVRTVWRFATKGTEYELDE